MIKKLLVITAIFLLLTNCTSANQTRLAGDWSGTLNMAGASLRLIFHITESDSGYSASIESVDQGGVIIPAEMEIDGDRLTITV